MPATFIYLSDIHFGQVKGGQRIVHNDVKERLIDDAASLVATMDTMRASGIIVTGDIAYAGKRDEYISAAKWLDRLAAAVGCAKTAVQVVPGNHDIDRDAISSGCKLMLDQIISGGEPGRKRALHPGAVTRAAISGRICGHAKLRCQKKCSGPSWKLSGVDPIPTPTRLHVCRTDVRAEFRL